jgi:SAM-dependent methyltransferase
MTFSRQWDQRFRANKNVSIWPWSDLVSYVCRYAKPTDGFHRVFEIGCGAGANIPFFLSLGIDYSAVEGSPTIVAMVHDAYPKLREKIVVGDFTHAIPFDGPFDLVVDRSSLPHNTTRSMQRTIAMIFDRLRIGGKFIGIDWLSNSHQDALSGEALDSHTRTNIPVGQFVGVGAVHFSDEDHLVDLLSSAGFRIDRLEHKRREIVIPKNGKYQSMWNFVATKP